jgi:Domain of unknown function (DUF4278)
MQLTYRNQTYTRSSTHTPHTLHTVYRGVPHTYTVQYQASPLEGLTYRGVAEDRKLVPVLSLSES